MTDRAIVECFKSLAVSAPLVLICDDLHWLDESSARVLNALAREVNDAPMLLLAVHRPEYQPKWSDVPDFTAIPLLVMESQTIRELVATLLEWDDPPTGLIEIIVKQSGGNPYFIEEVLRTFSDLGVLQKQDGKWHLTAEPSEVDVPESLHAVIMGRLDALSETCRRLLQTSSVVGRTFDGALLDELGWNLTSVLPHIDTLTDLQFLVETRPLPDPQWMFKQEFIQEVSYSTLLLQARRNLHAHVAEAMERLYAERLIEHVEMLQHHYMEAQRWMNSLHYTKQSAEKSRELFANQSAVEHYRQALDLIDKVEEDLSAEQRLSERVAALNGLGDVLSLMGDYDGSIQAYRDILDALKATDATPEDAHILEASALRNIGTVHGRRGEYDDALARLNEARERLKTDHSDPAALEMSKTVGQVGFIRFRKGDYDAAREQSRVSRDLAETVGSDKDAAFANLVWGISSFSKGDHEDALRRYEQCREVRERIGDVNGIAAVLQNIGNLHLSQSRHDEAESAYQRVLDIRRKVGDVAGTANVLNQLGNVRLNIGDDDGASAYYMECRDIFARIGNRFGLAVSTLNLGNIHNERGNAEEARAYFRQALEAAEPMQVKDLIADVHRGFAQAAVESGHLDEAQEHADAALTIATEIGNKQLAAQVRWIFGRLQTELGQFDDAAIAFDACLSEFGELKSRLWEGKTHFAVALLDIKRDRLNEARGKLTISIEIFMELDADRELERARQIESSLSA
ncbi:MAG: tetratricopeptide repeat protein [Candidatus Poribacteria bacterium]|nr:tetratricopeptide repeat protein [Candidatus Poribacteria bacterium]